MKVALQYVSDTLGNPQTEQLPFSEWEKVLTKLKKYEQTLQLKSTLTEAFEQVEILKNSKKKKQTLLEFIDEL